MARWFARLAFSLLLLAGVLLWEGYKELNQAAVRPQMWRVCAFFLGGGACAALSMIGFRERYRPRGD